MFITGINNPVTARFSALAATAIICLGLGTNGRVDAANPSIVAKSLARGQTGLQGATAENLPAAMQVLSAKDAGLYRAIFAAQKKDDWQAADAAIAQLADHRLMGHVLAARYQRRPASFAELKAWLDAYADLPEATAIYNEAHALPGAKAVLAKPVLADAWTGGDAYEGAFGLNDDSILDTPAARHLDERINHALKHNDPFAAETALEAERSHRILPAEELADFQSRIAAGFFYEGRTGAARRLAYQAGLAQHPLGLWIDGLSAWREGDAAAAANSFARLAAQDDLAGWDKAAAEFWAFRAYTLAGDEHNAHEWLARAAEQPHSFYGILASQLLGRKPVWSWNMPPLTAASAAMLSSQPAGWRALALLQAGQPDLAEGELRRINPHGHKDVQEAMLATSEAARMTALTLRLGGLATTDGGRFYDAALYPVPPWQPQKGFQVDRALLYALMRRESRFEPAAVSGHGACGLMQIMPSTARLISAGTVEAGRTCAGGLLNPAVNMTLGQSYVRRLAALPLVGDNLLYLLTAYNAGPGNLLRWAEGDEKRDPLFFIETMPAHETRDYVQQVMIQYWAYRARLGEPQTSLAQLARAEWPRYALADAVAENTLAPSTLPAGSIEVASGAP